MELAHTKTVEDVLAEFKVSEEEGLDNACVEELRKKHGFNGKIYLVFSGPFFMSLSSINLYHPASYNVIHSFILNY